MNPKGIPEEMRYHSAINSPAKKARTASEKSSHLMSRNAEVIITPTTTRAGAVAAEEMALTKVAISAFLATFVSAIPSAATAPALVVVGVMMTSAFRDIRWEDFSEAVPAFFAGLFMALCYSISYGIAFGFISYCLVKICKKEAGKIHPILCAATILFILNFVLLAVI